MIAVPRLLPHQRAQSGGLLRGQLEVEVASAAKRAAHAHTVKGRLSGWRQPPSCVMRRGGFTRRSKQTLRKRWGLGRACGSIRL